LDTGHDRAGPRRAHGSGARDPDHRDRGVARGQRRAAVPVALRPPAHADLLVVHRDVGWHHGVRRLGLAARAVARPDDDGGLESAARAARGHVRRAAPTRARARARGGDRRRSGRGVSASGGVSPPLGASPEPPARLCARSGSLIRVRSKPLARLAAMSPSARYAAYLVDFDGTLYRPHWVKLAMLAELSLFGLGALRVLRAFRQLHERVRL